MENIDIKVGDIEIPPNLIPNLIYWMRNKGLSDSDIIDCIKYICKANSEMTVE